jgi:hypothetical protein
MVALVGETSLRTEHLTSRRLFSLIESQSRRLSGRTALVYHFFEVVHFIERCSKFKHEMEAVMARIGFTVRGGF